MYGVVRFMKRISEESWNNIYTIFFETKTTPSVWPNEAVVSALHHMMYLAPEDITLHEEE